MKNRVLSKSSSFQLLEGIGKAKATQDEVFDQHAANLSKQAKTGERLQKDIKVSGGSPQTGYKRSIGQVIGHCLSHLSGYKWSRTIRIMVQRIGVIPTCFSTQQIKTFLSKYASYLEHQTI